jgi:[acyl-carrier-protein] S-malonyltransferase
MSGLVAILCSGQGAQHARMFDIFADCPLAEDVFSAATETLGEDPRIFVKSSADLFEGRAAQILCCTAALAAWSALGEARPARAVFAGYSVGELAAWGCAGALDTRATTRLAGIRANLMEAATLGDCGLAGIVGLRRSTLEPILKAHACHIAIVNDVDSFVIGGRSDEVEAVCRESAARGATRSVRLPVGVASHTPLLSSAVAGFATALAEASPRIPAQGFRLLSGVDGDTVLDIEIGCAKLARQIASPVDWAACLESCRAAGARLVLELGPGNALARMAERVLPEARVRSIEDFKSLNGLKTWLA